MSKRSLRFVVLLGVLCVPRLSRAQESPIEVSVCELAKNPKLSDGKTIRVRGTLNVYFEDFSLSTGKCESVQGIWLAFGGDMPGIVSSTVNDVSRKPGSKLEVNGVSMGLTKDDNFRKLYALIASRHGNKPDYRVTATLTGVFFAGKERKTPSGEVQYSGYGHVGCCALFVITQVSNVESEPPANLDVRGVVMGPDARPIEGFTVIDDVQGGSPPERQTAVTNARGEFSFSNSGQQLRFENPNYRPLALTVESGGAPVRVTMQDSKQSDWIIPICEAHNTSGRAGYSVLFRLPKSMESTPFKAEDTESLFIHRRRKDPISAELVISRTSDEENYGASSLGFDQFEERWIKDAAGNVIGIDARGRATNGESWRGAGFKGRESAAYQLKQGRPTQTFDRIIDSGCLAKP